MQPLTEMAPTAATERYELLDVLRGLALLGIVSANMIVYSLYLYLPAPAKAEMGTHATDQVLDFLELMLIEGKFYAIFSVLFGVGFSILLSRASAKGLVFHRFFLRRIAFLFVFGAAHAVLFWHSDILQAYAVCGALLLPFANARNRTIMAVATLALLTPIAIKLFGGIPVEVLTNAQHALFARFGFTPDTVIETWTRGDLKTIVQLNVCKWFSQVSFLITSGMLFKIYGYFLVGFCIGKNGIYQRLELYRPVVRRLATWGLALGLPLNFVYASAFDSGSWSEVLTGTLGILPLSTGYVCLLCTIWLDLEKRKRLRYFAPVGRIALTNYVGQSVISTLIFYGTGFGLGGTMGPTLYLPIGLAVYGFQVVFSQLWLERCSFGPLEWLWRVLTYGEWIRLTKRVEA